MVHFVPRGTVPEEGRWIVPRGTFGLLLGRRIPIIPTSPLRSVAIIQKIKAFMGHNSASQTTFTVLILSENNLAGIWQMTATDVYQCGSSSLNFPPEATGA